MASLAPYAFGLLGIWSSVVCAQDFREPFLWDEGTPITFPRTNIYNLPTDEFLKHYHSGELHTQIYPVSVTGLILPFESLNRILEAPDDNPIRRLALNLGGALFSFRNFKELYEWLGLANYAPSAEYGLTRPAQVQEPHRAGAAIIQGPGTMQGLSFSCLSCHASEFFGHTIVGLPNKHPRSNELFVLAKEMVPHIPSALFQSATRASPSEVEVYKRTRSNLAAVRPIKPLSLGLDTSLAHVGMSLTTRSDDPWATRSARYERFPRSHQLTRHRADSKPMPWWTLKYKNRWLSDGSVVSGNPIFTNLLWNEIGRGTDLHELNEWFVENKNTIKDLTVRVFASKAPSYLDIFPAYSFDIKRAKAGQRIFAESCARCHGVYKKVWDEPGADFLHLKDQIANSEVIYHQNTPVIDVGTESNRYEGMEELAEQLNSLDISRRIGVFIKPQKGYVPTPLEGIFARYPYMHNASIPNLCELLTPASKREMVFYQGPTRNFATDYDADCVGYPVGEKIPRWWKKKLKDARVDLRKVGRRNKGHDKMFLNADGSEVFSPEEKRNLIEFLKTL